MSKKVCYVEHLISFGELIEDLEKDAVRRQTNSTQKVSSVNCVTINIYTASKVQVWHMQTMH